MCFQLQTSDYARPPINHQFHFIAASHYSNCTHDSLAVSKCAAAAAYHDQRPLCHLPRCCNDRPELSQKDENQDTQEQVDD